MLTMPMTTFVSVEKFLVKGLCEKTGLFFVTIFTGFYALPI